MKLETSFLNDSLSFFSSGERPSYRKWYKKDPANPNKRPRKIHEPNKAMKKIQREIRRYLKEDLGFASMDYSHAPFSYVTRMAEGVEQHVKNPYMWQTDLESAYDNVDPLMLAMALHDHDNEIAEEYSMELNPNLYADIKTPEDLVRVANILRSRKSKTLELVVGNLNKYCFSSEGHLMTGSCVSQDLFDLYCDQWIDRKLVPILERSGITYTRYVDDLTFSAARPISRKTRKSILKVIRAAGFEINQSKTLNSNVRYFPAVVCGIQVGGKSSDRFLKISKK